MTCNIAYYILLYRFGCLLCINASIYRLVKFSRLVQLSKPAVVALRDMASTEPKLYVNACFTSFRRNKRTLNPNQALLKIEGVNSKEEAQFYVGKKVAAPIMSKVVDRSRPENWGTITQVHGNSGVVRAKFDRNLPPSFLGTVKVRVFLFPSNI